MEDVEKLRKKRKPIRGVITKFLNKVDDAWKEDPKQIDERKLKQYEKNLKDNFELLKQLDKDIFEGLVENDAEDDVCEKEVLDASDINERVTYCLICLEEPFKAEKASEKQGDLSGSSSKGNLNSVATSIADSVAGSEASNGSNASSTNRRRVKARLPKLELSKFNGKVSEWQEF